MSATREVVEGYAPVIRFEAPAAGRVFRTGRTVRLGDVGLDGRLRLDAMARYAQDVASDDVRDVGLGGRWGWVVRRTSMTVMGRPGYEEEVTVSTWCAALGAAWAERRTTLAFAGRPVVEMSGLWVCLDRRHGRPMALEPEFVDVFGPSAGGRRISRRLLHPEPPDATTVRVGGPSGAGSVDEGFPEPPGRGGGVHLGTPVPVDGGGPQASEPGGRGGGVRPWPLRHSDFDAFQHVNNAALWSVVDDEMARRHPGRSVAAASLEHREAIGPDAQLTVSGAEDGAGGLGLWISGSDGAVLATAMALRRRE